MIINIYICIYMYIYILFIILGILLYILLNHVNKFSVGNAYEISTWGIEDALPTEDTYVPLCDNILNHHKLPLNTVLKSDSTNNYNCKYVDYNIGTPEFLPEYLRDLQLHLNSIYKIDANDCMLECDKGVEGHGFSSWEYTPLNVDPAKNNKLNIDCKPNLTFYGTAHGQILVINNEINNTNNETIKNNDIFRDYYSKYPKIYLENTGISLITVPRTGTETIISFYLNDLAFNDKSSYNTNPISHWDPYTYVKKFIDSDPIPIIKQPHLVYDRPDNSYVYQEPVVDLYDKPPKISGFNKTLQSQFNHYKTISTTTYFEPKLHKKNIQHDIILQTDYNYYLNNMSLVNLNAGRTDILLHFSYNKIKLLSIHGSAITSITEHLDADYNLDSSYFDPTNLEIQQIKYFLNHERNLLSGMEYGNRLNTNEIDLFTKAQNRFVRSNTDNYYMSLENNYYKLNGTGNTNILLCKTYNNKINEIFIRNSDSDWHWENIKTLNLEYYFLDNTNKFNYANDWDDDNSLPDKSIEWPILIYWSTLYYIHSYINYKSLKPYLEDCLNGYDTDGNELIFDKDTYENTKLFNKDSFINNTPKRYIAFYSKHNNVNFSSMEPDGTQKSLIGEYTKILDIDLISRKELDAFYRLFNTDETFNYDPNGDSFYEKEVIKYQSGINDYELHLTSLLNGYDGPIGGNTEKDEYLKELKILQYNKTTLLSRS